MVQPKVAASAPDATETLSDATLTSVTEPKSSIPAPVMFVNAPSAPTALFWCGAGDVKVLREEIRAILGGQGGR